MTLLELKSIAIDGSSIEIRMRNRGRRRTRVMLSYHPDGILFVDSPEGTTERTLRILIYRSEDWLRREIRRFRRGDHIVYPSSYVSGTTLYLLGNPMKLMVRESKSPKVSQKNGKIWVSSPSHTSIQSVVHEWYREMASVVLGESVCRMCATTSLHESVPNWRHRYMSSRWGSCSSHGSMRLNTHLVKVPRDSIDMVVLHELCHFRQLNHGPEFYSLMDRYMPDWQQHDRTLRKYQRLLQEEFD